MSLRAVTARVLDTVPVGKVLVSAVAVAAPVGTFGADWNETHIYNPRWTPHARFHNAQTMVFAVELSAVSLWQLWARRPQDRAALRWGSVFASLYWLAQAPAILFPGTAFWDPEFEDRQPVVAGLKVNQVIGQVLILYPVLAVGHALAARRLARAASSPPLPATAFTSSAATAGSRV